MAKRKEKEYDPNLPLPQLEWRDGKPFVTDGWIMGSRVIVKQQPSVETVIYANKLFAEQARRAVAKGLINECESS